jgi:mannose-6-phosphate isomerase
VIAADPVGELGGLCASEFGGRLPFLLKVLAAEKALSIQVHPSRAQAQAGFRAENDRGLAPGDKSRNYVDDWPKPEILCALTPFEVFAGLRTPDDAVTLLLKVLGHGFLDRVAVTILEGERSQGLTTALAQILAWPEASRGERIDQVVRTCAAVADRGGPYAAACAATVRLATEHPGDLGIVASLLMRHAVLQPGQAVFMPAGGLHAYLHGTGVELLANSDNVVRAGLTPKHIDVPELLKLTDPAVAVPVLEPRPLGGGLLGYDSPVPEFRLYRAELGDGELELPGTGGPRIVFCTDGAGVLRASGGAGDAGGDLIVGRGESCFLSAADGVVTATGPASVFVAATGL